MAYLIVGNWVNKVGLAIGKRYPLRSTNSIEYPAPHVLVDLLPSRHASDRVLKVQNAELGECSQLIFAEEGSKNRPGVSLGTIVVI